MNNINTHTDNEGKRIIEINGIEFYVEDLVKPLVWLRKKDMNDMTANTSVLQQMEEVDLVRKKGSGGFMSPGPPAKWEQVDNKCKELFEELNEPYYRLKPEVEQIDGFGMWDEQEDEDAREKAEAKLEELRERNPDVEFELDEEEMISIPTE